MCVCICVCVCVCVGVCVCVCVCVFLSLSMYLCVSVCESVCITLVEALSVCLCVYFCWCDILVCKCVRCLLFISEQERGLNNVNVLPLSEDFCGLRVVHSLCCAMLCVCRVLSFPWCQLAIVPTKAIMRKIAFASFAVTYARLQSLVWICIDSSIEYCQGLRVLI